MSEFPALRESLVRAAARRRRRRLTIRATVPAFALAVAAVVLFLVPSEPREREREVATPAPARTPLQQAFREFRRPRTAADEVPQMRPALAGADWEGSRLLAKDRQNALYGVPTTEGMCVILRSGDGQAQAGCGPVAAMARESAATGTFRQGLAGYLFPDGTHDLTVTNGNGESWGGMGPTPNGVIVREPAGIAYTAASGTRYINGPSGRIEPPSGCPARLDPLPADADDLAVRRALMMVQYLYPKAARATGTAARPLDTPCSTAITRRTIEVRLQLKTASGSSLTQGRVLVGMVDGRMQVYHLVR